jgi:hypothetical protein
MLTQEASVFAAMILLPLIIHDSDASFLPDKIKSEA